VLPYHHFSVVLNRERRIAYFTAVNIDGSRSVTVDRTTGEPEAAEASETWYADPRVADDEQQDQSLYSRQQPRTFDRGHLVRRQDPNWGTPNQARSANADTFHWTNCSPQHFRFNESAKFWQGAERYVLENGVLAADARKRIIVFQGPIFDDRIDHSADNLQIPSSFFKVIVWKGASGLKAVGLVVDQLALLSEQRGAPGKPNDRPSASVSHWRLGIAQIEKRTGLLFGDAVRAADTIGSVAQPAVGAEAVIPINSFEDLLR